MLELSKFNLTDPEYCLFRYILVKLPADSPLVYEYSKYFSCEALNSYLHSSEEKVHSIHSTGLRLVRYDGRKMITLCTR